MLNGDWDMSKLLITIFVAFVCGSIAARIGGRKSGCLLTCFFGFLGSYLGQYFHLNFFRHTELPFLSILPMADTDIFRQIFWNVIGAIALILLMNLVFGPKKE